MNGSLPTNVEIRNNTLFFKGPVTFDLAGTYVCDATNGIGTRTGIVDVNITGRSREISFFDYYLGTESSFSIAAVSPPFSPPGVNTAASATPPPSPHHQ